MNLIFFNSLIAIVEIAIFIIKLINSHIEMIFYFTISLLKSFYCIEEIKFK